LFANIENVLAKARKVFENLYKIIIPHKEETYLGTEATASVVIHRSRTVLNKIVLKVLTPVL
jgi:hypothetical protein